MSIISCSQELQHPPYTHLGPTVCSQCPYPLTFPCVFRMTEQGTGLYLHLGCTHQWIKGFLKDTWTIEGMAELLPEDIKREGDCDANV